MEVILCVALCDPNFTVTAGLSTEMTAGTNQMVKFTMLFFQSYFTFDQARGVASYNAHGSLVISRKRPHMALLDASSDMFGNR